MVIGIFTIFDHDAYILIDPRSTCSFISHEFALRIPSMIEPLEQSLYISMPTGGIMVINTVMRACHILVDGETLYANLVVIKLDKFNVILGIDWLAKHHAIVNCYINKVVIDISG